MGYRDLHQLDVPALEEFFTEDVIKRAVQSGEQAKVIIRENRARAEKVWGKKEDNNASSSTTNETTATSTQAASN